MPHLVVEYTDNVPGIDPAELLPALNRVLAESGHFNEADIKSRAVKLGVYCIGTSSEPRGFVAARLAILSGRSLEIRRDLATRLRDALAALISQNDVAVQVTVEVREMERESYAKTTDSR